ncbi:MAG: DUF1840 domain-containing protein [Georgfuchsia sp.]
MIVTFKSPAAGDVIMFGNVAKRMMEIMGKEATAKGIVTVPQLPEAIARLREAIAADKAQRANLADEDQPRSEAAEDGGKRDHVSLAQRAAPLLELLERSLKKSKPVVWGV